MLPICFILLDIYLSMHFLALKWKFEEKNCINYTYKQYNRYYYLNDSCKKEGGIR